MNITELTLLFASQALPAEEAARARAESESMQARGQVVRFPFNEVFVEPADSEQADTLLLDRRARSYREQVSLSRVQRRLLLRGSCLLYTSDAADE